MTTAEFLQQLQSAVMILALGAVGILTTWALAKLKDYLGVKADAEAAVAKGAAVAKAVMAVEQVATNKTLTSKQKFDAALGILVDQGVNAGWADVEAAVFDELPWRSGAKIEKPDEAPTVPADADEPGE